MKYKPLLSGALAVFSLLTLYSLTMILLTRSWDATLKQFQALWWLMVPLVIAFGIQVGLYTKLKQAIQLKARSAVATTGTSAGIGMLACCAHHAADVLPILGLSVATTLIAQYQVPILSFSLLINAIGIAIMWNHVRKMI